MLVRLCGDSLDAWIGDRGAGMVTFVRRGMSKYWEFEIYYRIGWQLVLDYACCSSLDKHDWGQFPPFGCPRGSRGGLESHPSLF